ncbi:nitrate transporter [Amylibacter ulvae]|uniref:Nitrate transporter n=1 Tax=Paramylibacter ulvae TaxID=1651968 RepID=A0ABQ3CTR2_9RHOB|nr:CmpA/NrtA family ABC transporter substrate-binding protein [Amylibacter ulvae]GHA43487.1 nitrate transporter [Amylibacter ulvae]
MTTPIHCGFIPLTDAAPLIVAHELGFAEEENIALNLTREHSWSSIRDKLAFGVYDAAHMLAPMPIAMSLGKGQVNSKIIAPMVLSMNGDSFVFRTNGEAPPRFNDTNDFIQYLVKQSADAPIRIGVPFMHSMHVALLRFLIKQSGLNPAEVVDFSVAPPFVLAEVLKSGEVDGVFVGAPWGAQITDSGTGSLALNGSAIWAAAPEKVLGVRHEWGERNKTVLHRLIRAIYRAQLWIERPSSQDTLCEILARSKYVGIQADLIQQAFSGQMVLDAKGRVGHDPLALRIGGSSVGFPWISAAIWIAQNEASAWGVDEKWAIETAKNCFRPDIYRDALMSISTPMPDGNSKVEGTLNERQTINAAQDYYLGPDRFYDGSVFDPK